MFIELSKIKWKQNHEYDYFSVLAINNSISAAGVGESQDILCYILDVFSQGDHITAHKKHLDQKKH